MFTGELDWPKWKKKVRVQLDYHEGALKAIDGTMLKLESLEKEATLDHNW